MQDAGNGLLRIHLPGNSVNRGKREGPECSNSGPFGPTPMSHAMPRSVLPGSFRLPYSGFQCG